jgi:hypothetical protein
MDTPSTLKENVLPGLAWDVFAEPLLASLMTLEQCPCVLRAGLAGDHLRAITPADVQSNDLLIHLQEAGLKNLRVETVEPTLEDVFLALALHTS